MEGKKERKILVDNEDWLIFQSLKGYDYQFVVYDKKDNEGWYDSWRGFFNFEQQEFLDFCDNNNINLKNLIFRCINDNEILEHKWNFVMKCNSWFCPKCNCNTDFPLEDGCYIE